MVAAGGAEGGWAVGWGPLEWDSQQISLTVGNDPYTVTSGQFAGDPA